MNAEGIFKKYYFRLINLCDKAYKRAEYETALQAISAAANIAYSYNQFYTDDKLEEMLQQISRRVLCFKKWDGIKKQKKTVLFYDGFGVDKRGISIVVNKAICLNGYNLVYVSPLNKKDKQPTLQKELASFSVIWRYIDTEGAYIETINQLCAIFNEIKPDTAFLYTLPNDVAGITVFNALQNICFRIQLDLTDHAFWLGVNAFDICNGGRQFSASIQHLHRGIQEEKMTLLDANLFVDDSPFQGLPFDTTKRFVFSGGALYKTLGDENNTFYKIIDHILTKHAEINYLYAGKGNDSQMRILEIKYPNRVFLIDERPDFFQIIQRCILYLNTYPMFGGLMMRYAALAGKIPITLRHNKDSDGILIDQIHRQIEYNSYNELITDVDRLLSDDDYRKKREELLEGSVVNEECFVRNIGLLIEEHRTEFSYETIEDVDISRFRKECLERFTYEDIINSIAIKRNMKLLKHFPILFVHKMIEKVKK